MTHSGRSAHCAKSRVTPLGKNPGRPSATAPLGARLASSLLPLSYTTTGDRTAKVVPEADKDAFGLEVALGLKYIFFIWACVAIVTGILAYTTRGAKEVTEIEN